MSKREWDNYIDKQGPVPSGFRMDHADLLTVSGKLLRKQMITQQEYDDILRDVISREAGDTSVAIRAPGVGAPLPSSGVSRLPSDFADRAELPGRHFSRPSFGKPTPTGSEIADQIEARIKELETGKKDTSRMTGPEVAKYIENRLKKIKNVDEVGVDGAKFADRMEQRLERVSKVAEAADVLSAVEKKYKEVMSELIGHLLKLKDEGAKLTKSQEETIKRFAMYGFGKIRKCQGSGKYQDELLRLLRASPAYNNPATRDEAQRTHDIYVRRLKLEGPSTHGFFKKTNTDTKDDLIRQFRDELARITHTQTRIDRANAIRATYDAYIAARDAYAADPTNEELYATAYAAYETATRAFREANPSVNLAPSEAPSGPPRAPPPIPPRRGPPPAPPPRAPREDYERPNTPAQNLAEIRAFFAGIENKATALEAIRRIAPLMPQIRDQIQAGQIDVTPFKKQAKKALLNLHPDKGGDETTFQELINMLGESHGLNLYGNAKPRKCRKCHGYKY